MIDSQQAIVASGWALLTVCLVLFALGLKARIVVFFDWRDLAWTLTPPAALLAGLVMSRSLLPAPGSTGTTALADTVWIAAKAAATLGLLVSMAYAVRFNGLLLGTVIFVFKYVALTAAVLLAILLWPAKGRANPILLPVVIVGCMVFLINGQRVLRRRATRRSDAMMTFSAGKGLSLVARSEVG